MNALLWKETREHLRWLPVGLLVIAALCWYVHPTQPAFVQFSPLAYALASYLGIALPLLAFALGLLQCYRDLQPAARAYLHHREVTATQLIIAKLLVGFALYSLCALVPIGLLASWIAYQGMEWYPMRPAQVVPALVMALGAFLWHPAAMLMMVRQASWWGTKWFPLFPAAALHFFFMVSLPSGGLRIAAIGTVIAVPLLAWMFAMLCEQWQVQPNDPPPHRANSHLRHRLLLPTLLLISSFGILMGLVAVAISTYEAWNRSSDYIATYNYETTILAFEKSTSKPALLSVRYKHVPNEGNKPVSIRGNYLEQGKTWVPHELPNEIDRYHESSWLHNMLPSLSSNTADGFFSSITPVSLANLNNSCTYDSRGFLHLYRGQPSFQWASTISADGIHARGELFGAPFTTDPVNTGRALFANLYNDLLAFPLIDGNGMYTTNWEGQFDVLLRQTIHAATMLPLEANQPVKFAVRGEQSITIYQFANLSAVPAPYKPGPVALQVKAPESGQPFKATEVASYPLTPEMQAIPHAQIVHTEDGRLYYCSLSNDERSLFIVNQDGLQEKLKFSVPTGSSSSTPRNFDEVVAISFLPTTYMLFLLALAEPLDHDQLVRLLIGSTIGLTTAIALTAWAAKRRGLSRKQTIFWSLAVLLFGLSVPLAIIAIYKRLYRVQCHACQQPRRLDLDQCEHCHAQWPLQSHGAIELRDPTDRPLAIA